VAIGAGLVRFQGKSGPQGNLYVGPLRTQTFYRRKRFSRMLTFEMDRTSFLPLRERPDRR
jgi:hypothetical protein